MEQLIAAIPLIAAAIASFAIAMFREHIWPVLPDYLIPIVLPIAGGIIAGLAKALGFDIGDFNAETADLTTWQTVIAGVLSGLAMTGLHQAQKQVRERPGRSRGATGHI